MNFENTRRQLAEQMAGEAEQRLDPHTGMLPGPRRRLATGAHSQADGWDIRSTAEMVVPLAATGRFQPAWRSLAAVLDHQDRDPRSMTYGNFFWYSGWTRALDPNAVSFIVPPLCYVLKHHGNVLPPDLRRRTEEALALSVDGLNAHRATWGYTNIALLNMASKLLVADVLEDPRARDLAYWDWEEWRNHTIASGAINEYSSLTYTWVQIHALAMMLTCRADARFLCEVRAVMRHLITAAVLDYHPGIGRITGPQSRAYDPNRRLRGASLMDDILHLVLGTPPPGRPSMMWLGAPIGPEDILPAGRNPGIPRTTTACALGFTRTNYLAPDYALGSISGDWPWEGHQLPFLLAYRTHSARCSIAVTAPRAPVGHFSRQSEGSLLAACTWLLDPDGNHDQEAPDWWRGQLTGLNTGRPHNLVEDRDWVPELVFELGRRGEVRVLDASGQEPAAGAPLRGDSLWVETESIRVGLRFAGPAGAPALSLSEEPDSEVLLTVRGSRDGLRVGPRETTAMLAFFLNVTPTEDAPAGELPAVEVTTQEGGWLLRAPAAAGEELSVRVPAGTGCFYATEGVRVSPNEWALSLREGDTRPA